MNNGEKDLEPLDQPLPRKRRFSFSYWVTVALMGLVIFAAMKYEAEDKGAPAHSVFEKTGP